MTIFCITAAVFAGLAQTPPSGGSLPAQKLGPDDLISIQVYNFPEFSRSVRVSTDGTIRLPLVKEPIPAAGHLPVEMEALIAGALRADDLIVNPVVTVSVLEYESRPISVIGAVKNPLIFQAIGRVMLSDAIIRAGGLTPDAGPEILISRKTGAEGAGSSADFTQHIFTRELLGADNNAANIELKGGEEVRVPPAARVFVLGNVKTPGAFALHDLGDTTVMKALALSGGVAPYASAQAWVIRKDEPTGTKHKIPIELRAILAQKAPDYPLVAEDILFVPDDKKRRETLLILDRLVTIGTTIGTGLILYNRY